MTSTACRRVAKLEGALHPREAVLAWLVEAQQYPSLVDHVRSIAGLPVEAAPFSVIGARVEAAVRDAMRGQPRDAIEAAVRRAIGDGVFLFSLALGLNVVALEMARLEGLRATAVFYWMGCLLGGPREDEGVTSSTRSRPLVGVTKARGVETQKGTRLVSNRIPSVNRASRLPLRRLVYRLPVVVALTMILGGCGADVATSSDASTIEPSLITVATGSPTATPTVAPRPESPTVQGTVGPTPTPQASPVTAEKPTCPDPPYTLDKIATVPDGWSPDLSDGWSSALALRAICFGRQEVTFVAAAYTPVTTADTKAMPAAFRTPVAFVRGYDPGGLALEAWLADGAIAPGDERLVGSTEGCPPSSCDQVWWQISGSFAAAIAEQCSPPGPYSRPRLDEAEAIEYCRNSFFVDSMHVALERHVVQPGETFSGIARDHGVTLDEFVAANPLIANPDLIHVGDVVTVRLARGICRDMAQRPSMLQALHVAIVRACYGATTLSLEAQLACIQSDVDWFPYEVPPLFLPVYLGRNPPCLAILVDIDVHAGPEAFMTSVPLRVSDRSIVPNVVPVAIRVHVEGHFDDPASLECRPPAELPDWSVDDAIESCRARFIVTALTSAA